MSPQSTRLPFIEREGRTPPCIESCPPLPHVVAVGTCCCTAMIPSKNVLGVATLAKPRLASVWTLFVRFPRAQALRTGQCSAALVGGVNLILGPALHLALDKLGVLSPDGTCRTFDARANGMVRGEGALMALLELQSDDPGAVCAVPYATIVGSCVSHTGQAHPTYHKHTCRHTPCCCILGWRVLIWWCAPRWQVYRRCFIKSS